MKRFLSLMSLCMKAGKMATGETAAEIALRNGTATLLLIASDASANTQKKFINKCFYYKKTALVYGEKETLSRSVGKHNRTVFVITDKNFSDKLASLVHLEVDECPKPEYTNWQNS
jgi:ribosomal protein L7Ae-like RNA K-turn-binding protein